MVKLGGEERFYSQRECTTEIKREEGGALRIDDGLRTISVSNRQE